ncbi:cytochrome c3 family protein [uncultured Roseivirga sp.]|uniref:cytochrome c3 family protein n=1 Tax=uncultured Roseivirga sp. TaxID=543088 RepID=UPI0030DB4000|tara:strand:+ start:4470 stop:5708 length:1239 start_codon:yes stop_codon:yes gene_type:complete
MLSKKLLVRFVTACLFVCCFVFSGQEAFAQRDKIPTDEAIIKNGESLFKEYICNSCHAVDKKVVGPALAGVYDRREVDWIYSFVKSPGKMINDGDPQAVALFKEYNQIMPNQDLAEDQILAIMAYVRHTEENPPVEVVEKPTNGEVTAQSGGVPSEYLNVIMVTLIVVLVLLLIVLVIIINFVGRYLRDKKELSSDDEEIVNEKFSVTAFLKSPTVIGIITFLVVALAAKNVIDGLYTVGVQQGYAPTQPIPFSHELHAGVYEIDCQYCHTGVEIAKNANIPSVNICMNCHSEIKTDSPQIQKLYAAQESGRPIEWVRVHNLPDLAYFNHSQHVTVGEIECQTCHGEVQEMEVVKQFAPLTMGWCIDCHRNTDVNTQGNGYYDKLVEMHNATSKTPMKVADIGGLECAKCHY